MFIKIVRYVLVFMFLSFSFSAHAALNDYFVTTDWLDANFQTVRVVDVRNPAKFVLGHIEGAANINKSQFLAKRNGVKSLIPTADEFRALMEKYGIARDTTVVAYARDNDPYSARFIWMLKYYGHEKAYVLDGGYTKWSKENRLTSLVPLFDYPISRYPVPENYNLRAEANEILNRIGQPEVVVWDTRRPTEYAGTEIRADRGGHIPGAVHLNWTDLQIEKNGVMVLKDKAAIVKLLAEHGLTSDKEIIAHCQTGIRSSYATLVLLGLDYAQVKNYDGSWIEWANNPELPIVSGNETWDTPDQVSSTCN